jgi:hypothetical protein
MKPVAHRAQRGQVLVIVAMGMVAIVAMVGLVIDGGLAWVRQRDNQNGADSVAKAGTVVVQYHIAQDALPGETAPPNDYDVACAAAAAAASNGVVIDAAEYVDFQGQPLVPPVAVGICTVDLGAAIPDGAQGVKARTSETFDTLLMPVIGVPTLTTIADAIAVVGAVEGIGGALPVTFPETIGVCDDTNATFPIYEDDGVDPWVPYGIIDEADADPDNLAILPLCRLAPGSVGWIDWGCGQNLQSAIEEPCDDILIPIPAWVHTQTGRVDSLEDEINAYAGSNPGVPEADDTVLALPIHNNTCDEDVPDYPPDYTPNCPTGDWSGNGDNLYYHIPYWIGFKLDQAHTQGGDVECELPEGQPQLVNPGGDVGCLKGWLVDKFTEADSPVSVGPLEPGTDELLGVTLIN